MAAALPLPSLADLLLHSLRSHARGLVLMGVRDGRTRRGKVFRGSNGVTRPARAGEAGWWHRLRSLADIPVPGLGQAPAPAAGTRRTSVKKA